jgi:4-azaleucine resistance transporter AzlC
MAGYIVLGTGFGILMHNAGYGVLWTAAMSIFIYAGSMQYVGVNLLTGGASVIATALTTVMVNARHLFYSISRVDLYKDAGKYKPYMIFALTDETYSLLCDGNTPEGSDPNEYRFFVSMFNHSYWVTGSVLGSLLGAVIPFSTAGIEFSMTALFIAAFTEQWLTTRDHIPALTGLLSTLVCLVIFGRDRFLIPAMLLITLVLTLLRGREESRAEEEPHVREESRAEEEPQVREKSRAGEEGRV